MTCQKLLRSVLAAMWPVAACGVAAGQPDDTLKALREKVIQADRLKDDRSMENPWRVKAEAYKTLFLKVGRAGLRDLMKDGDTGIALQAAWETHRKLDKKPAPDGLGYSHVSDRGVQGEFLTFLKGRTQAPVPGWWADSIVTIEGEPGERYMFPLLRSEELGRSATRPRPAP
jgi:hypothetical protein